MKRKIISVRGNDFLVEQNEDIKGLITRCPGKYYDCIACRHYDKCRAVHQLFITQKQFNDFKLERQQYQKAKRRNKFR